MSKNHATKFRTSVAIASLALTLFGASHCWAKGTARVATVEILTYIGDLSNALRPAIMGGVAYFLIHCALVNAGESEKYHGLEFSAQNPPPGYKTWAAMCIATELSETSDCVFSIEQVEISTATSRKILAIFLLSDVGAREKRNTPPTVTNESVIWRVEDSIEYPSDNVLEYISCVSRANPKSKVIAYGKWLMHKPPKDGAYMRPIKKAWRVDAARHKFVEIPPKDVVCNDRPDDGI